MSEKPRNSETTRDRTPTRRALLVGIGAVLTLGVGGTVLVRWRDRARAQLLAELIERIDLADSPPALGRAFIEAYPAEADPDFLLDALAPRGAGPEPRDLERQLAERIDGEFRAREVVVVDGWVLAVTEARLLAQATLLRKEAP